MGNNLNKLVFQPPESTYDIDKNLIKLETRTHQTILAFFIDRDAPLTLLFSHGNAEDLGMIVPSFREVATMLNVNVFAYEYTGYGQSTGSPSEKGFQADIEAAFKYLRDVLHIPWEEIVLFGRSVGSGPSCYLAVKTAVRGIILQSPVLSILRVAFPLRYTLPLDLFANGDLVSHIEAPCFVIHGTRDEIVPFRHGVELARRAKNAYHPFWVDGGGHNNLELICYHDFYAHIKAFLEYLIASPPSDDLLRQAAQSDI
eukprot:GEMP01043972.1.p1 GENE.GEMP01043972.1~~GEMP01043972.1.p1  ORF type:complete len:257 (+),score=30.14 GEMP01043972.1:112-882(+)